MSRILIDLTDIEQWNGIHGGTQRVVYGIAKHFYKQQDSLEYEIKFISFAADRKQFYETSFEPIYHRVEGVEEVPHYEELAIEEQAISNLKTRIKPLVPETIRRNKTIRKAAKKVFGVVQDEQPEPQEPAREWIEFAKNDIVLMLGKPWDNLDIQRTLTSERQRAHFRLVQVVYDMIICLYPHLHHPSLVAPYTEHMLGAIANSDLLLPISKSSARDVEAFAKQHGITPPEMKVIRLGDTISTFDEKKLAKPSDLIAAQFIACVGTLEIRKNHTLLYYTYKLAAERGIELPQLVIVGSPGWLSGDVQHLIATDPAIKDKIIILHGVEDTGLAWVFKNCLFSVYPSMYEGWGLPVAESLVYGKGCVASNASSIPEIAGDLVDYFSPYSPEECLAAIEKNLDVTVRKEKEAEIKKSYKQTTWEETFQQVLSDIGK